MILTGYSEMFFTSWYLGPVSTMRNFVWFAKNSVDAKQILVGTIFCIHQNFCKRNETSEIRPALQAAKVLSGEKILFSLTSISHLQISQVVYNLWIECSLSEHKPLRGAVNRRMTLYPFAYIFLRMDFERRGNIQLLSWVITSKSHNSRILATKTINYCWHSTNRFCMKSKRQESAISTFRGSIFHSQMLPETSRESRHRQTSY